MDKAFVQEYFQSHASDWVRRGYGGSSYDYPTALHRARVVAEVLAEDSRCLQVVDLGCGAGQLALALARQGHEVVALDRSATMIALAKEARLALEPDVRKKVRFVIGDVEATGMRDAAFDAVTSLGVIGYLEKDGALCSEAYRLLRRGGVFAVSSRNRLFNMFSLTERTECEIRSGDALSLLAEIRDLYAGISPITTVDFVRRLKQAVAEIERLGAQSSEEVEPVCSTKIMIIGTKHEPRQHTPRELREAGERAGFVHCCEIAVHPHLLDPNMNRLLPGRAYNLLSGALEVFERHPISLLWSSVIVSIFRKPSNG